MYDKQLRFAKTEAAETGRSRIEQKRQKLRRILSLPAVVYCMKSHPLHNHKVSMTFFKKSQFFL